MWNHLPIDRTPLIDSGSLGFFSEKEVLVTVLRGNTQFFIKVTLERVKCSLFGKELEQQLELCRECQFGRYGSLKTPADLVFQYCLPLFERLAPQTSLQDLSLESFLHAPTYNLELVDTGMSERVVIQGTDQCSYMPAFGILPMPAADLPESCQGAPHLRACDIWIAPMEQEMIKSLQSVQGRVMTKDGASLFFKPRLELRGLEFDRELRVLAQISCANLGAESRVPRLDGIVVSGAEGDIVMGMLMTLITSPKIGRHLQDKGLWDKQELHKKWEAQVSATVQELHANDIVWGDVNPMNVVIDEAFDAWVIDFGGMNNIEFVDNENRETVQGDMQGMARLFQDWLPSRTGSLEENADVQAAPAV